MIDARTKPETNFFIMNIVCVKGEEILSTFDDSQCFNGDLFQVLTVREISIIVNIFTKFCKDVLNSSTYLPPNC